VISCSNFKPQNSLEKEESQISDLYLKNSKNTKTTKIEGLPTEFEGKITKKRGTPTSCVIPNTNPARTIPKPYYENPPKGSENHQKRKNGIHKQITRGHKDELQTFHSP
jgi:hypothetical protein